MRLFGTPPSHFTRKVRVILQELALPCEFVLLDRLMETGEDNFAGNPLHQFPVLEDGERRLIESDLICEYLLEEYGHRNDALVLFPAGDRWEQKKRLAVMNGGMAAGVKLIRAKRSGITWDVPFFRQEEASVRAALRWLETDLAGKTSYEEGKLSLLDITLVCFAEWAPFRELIPGLADFPAIQRFVERQGSRASFASTHPSKGAA